MSVPTPLFGNIIGKRGATIKKLRADTDTKIDVPNGHRSNEKVVVTGSSRQKVCQAARRINQIISDGKRNMRPTHFVGIPLNVSPIKENFEEFKKFLLNDQRFLHIDEILYQDSNLLHLTFDVFPLLDTEERLLAVDTLKKCDEAVKKYIQENCPDGKVRVHMKGIDIFSDEDGSSVSVLFGKINPECKAIQDIANIISATFKGAGVSVEKRNNPTEVRLHCTLINNGFIKRADDSNEKFKTRQRFNASKILEEFKDYDFGEIELSEIHISQMGTKGINGFYEASSVLKFL
ncbi:ASCC1 family protein [Megaselia abdita]